MSSIVFASVVGSRAFTAETEQSDYDIMVCYQIPFRTVLITGPPAHSFCKQYERCHKTEETRCNGGIIERYDITFIEIGAFMRLLKGNSFNMLVALFSPLTLYETPRLFALRDFYKKRFNPGFGFVKQADGFLKGAYHVSDERSLKFLRMACRELGMACNLLRKDELMFSKIYCNFDDKVGGMLILEELVEEVHRLVDLFEHPVQPPCEYDSYFPFLYMEKEFRRNPVFFDDFLVYGRTVEGNSLNGEITGDPDIIKMILCFLSKRDKERE